MMRISGKEGRPYSILFRGCSFLIVYEAGVLSALWELSPDMLKSASRIYGSSSGSIVATAGLCGCDIDGMRETLHSGLTPSFWGLIPGGRVLKFLRDVLDKHLPPNAHELVSGKLHIVLTRVHDWKSVTVSQFASKDDLIQAVLCSCFIPLYFGFFPPTYHGVRYVDGELAMWRADFVSRTTITVSAFAGEYDICPKDGPAAFFTFQLSDCILQISKRNLCRLQHIFQIPTHQVMDQLFVRGYQDTVSFLKRLSKCLGVRSRQVDCSSYVVGLLTEVDFSVDYFEGFTLSFTNGSQQEGEETLHLKPALRVLCSRATDPKDVTEENPGTIPVAEEDEAPHHLLHPQKGPGQPQKSIFGSSLCFKERMNNLQPILKAEPNLH